MKIVGVDNLARESVADKLWLNNIPDNEHIREQMQRVCDKLNEGLADSEGTFYTLKPDKYRLSRGMEDLI